ncbi:MAG: Uma2 family endonuclease [Chloroflexi bacterium]|nr:MAG: Uma2 family endonuclease [Chloroflexota bacterium]
MTVTATALEYQLRSIDASWDYAKWEQLPDDGNRYEVIDGVLYMSTAPGFDHQNVVIALVEHVGLPLKHAGMARFSIAPIGLIMPGADPVQPDFILVRSDRAGIISEGRIRAVPDLIAEVVSPSNPSHDTVIKRAAYARAGVPEYWIVLPDTREVLVLSEPVACLAEYAESHRFTLGMELVSATLPIRVPVESIFKDLTA